MGPRRDSTRMIIVRVTTSQGAWSPGPPAGRDGAWARGSRGRVQPRSESLSLTGPPPGRANAAGGHGPRSEVTVTVSRVRVGPAWGSKLLGWRTPVNRVSSPSPSHAPAGLRLTVIRVRTRRPPPCHRLLRSWAGPGPEGHVAADSDDARSSPGRCDGPVPGLGARGSPSHESP